MAGKGCHAAAHHGMPAAMMFLYSLLLGTGLAVSSPWWAFRMLTTRRYREGLRERLGRVPAQLRRSVAGHNVLWIHAVSVGEVLATSQLIGQLEHRLAAVDHTRPWRVMISTTTRTGQTLARERFGKDRVFWFPLDFAWAVRAWLRVLQPRLLVLVESELWPRLLRECRRQGIPVAVVNARLSDRSFRRAQKVRRLWTPVLHGVSVFLAQSDETSRRLRALGVPAQAVQVTGNLKYDIAPRETAMVDHLRPLLGRHSLVVAGSLLDPEERLLLEHWPEVQKAVPHAVLLLAPRHPERFHEVANLAAARFHTVRASGSELPVKHAGEHSKPTPDVIVLDTVGDLAAVYSLADVAFVGGSLAPRGGHNPLEPARFGVPVLIGPSYENFREIVAELQASKGIEIVQDGTELARTLTRLLKDRVEADALGQRGLQVFGRSSGATERSVAALLPFLTGGQRPGETSR